MRILLNTSKMTFWILTNCSDFPTDKYDAVSVSKLLILAIAEIHFSHSLIILAIAEFVFRHG